MGYLRQAYGDFMLGREWLRRICVVVSALGWFVESMAAVPGECSLR